MESCPGCGKCNFQTQPSWDGAGCCTPTYLTPMLPRGLDISLSLPSVTPVTQWDQDSLPQPKVSFSFP